MTDTQIVDWIEAVGAQLWRERHSRNWTCQVIAQGQVIQPTRATLRAAIVDARAAHRLLKGNNTDDRPKPTNRSANQGAANAAQ